MSTRGRYTRVCVEVNLTKLFVSRFAIGKYTYIIEYEHLHYFCFACGKVGHRKEYCSIKPVQLSSPTPAPACLGGERISTTERVEQSITATSSSPKTDLAIGDESQFDPWMLVNRRNRKPMTANRQSGPTMHKKPNNRFGPLTNKHTTDGTTDDTIVKGVQVSQPTNPSKATSSATHLHSNLVLAVHTSKANPTAISHPSSSSDMITQVQDCQVQCSTTSKIRPEMISAMESENLRNELAPINPPFSCTSPFSSPHSSVHPVVNTLDTHPPANPKLQKKPPNLKHE
ncbi:uncharacterized protein LOC114313362 [Camellia sinensis]|uniref:uncharacterized protein LOC114313362 n=1 Tax=Camellia sinensis TaxID=4442 RepID=UPI00103637E0|nr:uncharacterized protein LOC114313362 [Camellia sinensis]